MFDSPPDHSRRRVISAALLAPAATLIPATIAPTSAGARVSNGTSSLAAGRAGGRRELADIVLVHGAWADGSSWRRVIDLLGHAGHRTFAVPLPLESLAGDAQVVRDFIASQGVRDGAVLVGHSYGGAVISVASRALPMVAALVYTAAFAPDEGESLLDIIGSYPAPEGLQYVRPDPQGRVYLDRDQIRAAFAPDVDAATARLLAATQRPILGSVFAEKAGAVGWRDLPSWFLVSANDKQVSPIAQRAAAARMNARTSEVRASHVALISRPHTVTRVIRQAAQYATRSRG